MRQSWKNFSYSEITKRFWFSYCKILHKNNILVIAQIYLAFPHALEDCFIYQHWNVNLPKRWMHILIRQFLISNDSKLTLFSSLIWQWLSSSR